MLAFIKDIQALYKNDPSARGIQFLLSPGFQAIFIHRYFSHPLYKIKLYFIAEILAKKARFLTGIEIHPGAKIAKGFFIDHGMGSVIGETAEIGENCFMFHMVTLGGIGNYQGKRHPTIGDNVMIGTGSTLLGPIKIGNYVKIGAKTLIMNDVPSNCTVVGNPGKIIKKNNKRVNINLKKKI